MIVIELFRDNYTRGFQLSISQEDDNGTGDGYRIFGPKFLGDSKPLHRHVLDERDAAEIRAYLDREFPEPFRPPAPSEASIQAAREIVADIIAETRGA